MRTNSTADASRRDFLQSSLALTGLVLSGQFQLRGQGSKEVSLNAWVRVAADDTVTLIASQAEMGQGAGTTLPAILAEELCADWKKVRVEQCGVNEAYKNPRVNWQFTGNSESITGFFELLRRMGASAREALIQSAANRWRVAPKECVAEAGFVIHVSSVRRFRFGELAEAAGKLKPQADPPLKQSSEWKLLGRVELPAKLNGSAVFGLDFRLPGMLFAAIAMPPTVGGKVGRYDRTLAVSMPGVVDVVELPDGIAVVADTYWRARKALAATPIEFDPGPNATLDTAAVMSQYKSALEGDQWTRVKLTGQPPGSGEKVTADYESQFMAHATMEPMNCTTHTTDDRCEIWGPIQGQQLVQLEVAAALKLSPEKVFVNRTLLGGGFGRRLYGDYAQQAALLSRAVGRPVQAIWTRETDMQHDGYRPAVLNRLTAILDDRGRPTSLSQRLVSPTILLPVFPTVAQAPYDPSCVEGTLEWHYKIPHWQVDFHQLKVPMKTSVMRTTDYGPNLFAIESFIDELAARAMKDPWQYRRELLGDDTRCLAVLDLVAEKSGWRQKAPAGHFRGIAFAEAFRTLIAHVVELSVKWANQEIGVPRIGEVTIHKVTCAFDCGIALDPDISKSSMEGGIAWGLTCAFKSEVTFSKGAVDQSNFHNYELLNIAEMPPVEVHYINSDARLLGGTGEVGPVTVLPAVANALFAATGKRYRSLPLSRHGLRLAASRKAMRRKGTDLMKIALLGSGNVGGALGTAWVKSGHEVFFGVRDPNAADLKETLGAREGRARAGTPAQAVAFADVVAVALPWPAVDNVLRSLDVAGKIVIDCTNPPAGLHGADGKPSSGAEIIAARFPRTKVAKCFNITGANNMANPMYAEGPATMFVCADDAEAKAASMTLSGDAGFETYYLGPLNNARLLESLAQLWIWLAYRGGLGREFAFRLVRREAAK